MIQIFLRTGGGSSEVVQEVLADLKKRQNCVTVYFFGPNCFSCDCSFSANMSKLPKPNKKTLYFHLYFRARKKCSLSPINLFQENIWRKHWFGLSAGNFTVREAIFLKVIFSRKILSFLPSYFESWHLSEINSIFWNTCAIQYINCCTSFIQRNGGYFYTFRVL